MALGCPVISFARGVAPELIIHGTTGFLVETVEEMASVVPEITALNRYEAHQHVARHFSAEVMAKKYLDIYSKLLVTYTPPPVD
jgi:glycosyltransferase involved in cell wall biosynthesis